MREKLIELLGSKVCDDYSPTCDESEPHSCEKCFANNCRIGDLADYLLKNNVVVLPCKVGDTIYFPNLSPKKIIEATVTHFKTKENNFCIYTGNFY